ncbi:phage minor capsid protein [Streptomyces sp. NPDC057717]|uniref:phage minor capsid protein n=1 Tax=Streptomyces sp. NPDC057717 TaxID=3346224 RepID=UPI0036839CD2
MTKRLGWHVAVDLDPPASITREFHRVWIMWSTSKAAPDESTECRSRGLINRPGKTISKVGRHSLHEGSRCHRRHDGHKSINGMDIRFTPLCIAPAVIAGASSSHRYPFPSGACQFTGNTSQLWGWPVPIHPGMVEDLAAGTRDLYEQAEQRLLGIIARQLADGLDVPGWAERKLSAVQSVRRSSQAVVDELGKAVTLDVFDGVAQAYDPGTTRPWRSDRYSDIVAEVAATPLFGAGTRRQATQGAVGRGSATSWTATADMQRWPSVRRSARPRRKRTCARSVRLGDHRAGDNGYDAA